MLSNNNHMLSYIARREPLKHQFLTAYKERSWFELTIRRYTTVMVAIRWLVEISHWASLHSSHWVAALSPPSYCGRIAQLVKARICNLKIAGSSLTVYGAFFGRAFSKPLTPNC